MTRIQGRHGRPTRELCPGPSSTLGIAFALLLAASAPAAAFEFEVADEWEIDTARTTLKGHVESSFALATGNGFALTVAPKPEANRETDDRLRAITDRGAYVDTLELVWTNDTVTVTTGKLTPNFGYASQVAPGITGDELAKSYELGERVGATLQFGLTDEVTLSASRFFRDTSLLGRSTATAHGRLRLADGGPGNTGRPDSTALALDVAPEEVLPGLHLHAAWLHQAAGRGDASGQHAWVVGAAQQVVLGDVTVTPVVEYARSRDALGFAEAVSAPGARQGLLTLAVGVALDDWHAAAVWQRQDDRLADATRFRSDAYEISLGYLLGDGLSADVGYRVARADGSSTSGISTRLGYRVEF